MPIRVDQVNHPANASNEDDLYNYYYNYVDTSGSGGGSDDSAAVSSSGSSSYYDYLLPKLDQLTAPTDTLIRDGGVTLKSPYNMGRIVS